MKLSPKWKPASFIQDQTFGCHFLKIFWRRLSVNSPEEIGEHE
jgi:hypothetical protein